jgi:hypothetical protein
MCSTNTLYRRCALLYTPKAISHNTVYSIIVPFRKASNLDVLEWIPLALRIIELSPDRVAVLDELGRRIYPHVWSGSLAEILEGRRALFQTLMSHPDATVVAWARARGESLVREIEGERLRDRRVDIRFE